VFLFSYIFIMVDFGCLFLHLYVELLKDDALEKWFQV